MAIPTSYTEEELKTYMETVLGPTATKLSWSVSAGHFDEPVNEVLFFLGESAFSFADDNQTLVKKLRMVARMEVWRAAAFYTAHEASFSVGSPGTGQTSRADVHRHCKEMFTDAKSELEQTFPELFSETSWAVERIPVEYDGDYYSNAGETVS